ncbi:MAG: hypothetical protein U0354_15955 [Candidatus Sericytochromatia bacterium]
MKSFTKLFIISSLLLINSCASSRKLSYELSYNVNLDVAKDKNIKENVVLKKKVFILDEDKNFKFEDQFIKTEWDLERQGIWFNIINKTNEKIKIIWTNAYFSDKELGTIQLKKYNLDEYKDESIIIPESFYENTFYPYKSSKYSYFQKKIIVRESSSNKKVYKILEDIYEQFINNPIQLLIPIEINGQLHEYRFIFSVNEINLEDK